MAQTERKHWLTYRNAYHILLVLTILSFIPILFICKYDHMSADDFAYGVYAHHAWQETHSLAQTLQAAGEMVVDKYENWQGTFSSIFLMAMQPGIFGERYYPIGAAFLILLYAACFYFFGHIALTRLLRADKYRAGIVTLVMMLICTQWMQAPVQAFYFYNAGAHYIFMLSMLFLALAMEILIVCGTKKKIICMIAGMLLGIVIGGGNFITAFLYLLLSVTILAVCLLQKKREGLWQIPALVCFIAAFLVSVTAPGNSVRKGEFEAVSPLKSIWLSFQFSSEACNLWLNFSVICVFLLLAPLLWMMLEKTAFAFPLPGIAVVYAYCLLAAMYTPSCYATGFPGAGRCKNIYQIAFYMMLLFDLIYLLGYLHRKMSGGSLSAQMKRMESFFCEKIWLPSAAVALGFLLFFMVCGEWNNYMSLSAVKSVLDREAQLYHVQCLEREHLLLTSTEKRMEISATSAKPKLLFFDDITTDRSDWRNKSMAKWYGKKSVVLK